MAEPTEGGAVDALLAQAREVLAEIEDKLISQHPEAVRDFNQVFEPGGGIEVSAQWISQSLAEQQDRIAQIVREVQAESEAADETGMGAEAQTAAAAVELAAGTVGKAVDKPLAEFCHGPLRSVIEEITRHLEADGDADPADLFELGDEDYQLIFDELFGDVFQETADS